MLRTIKNVLRRLTPQAVFHARKTYRMRRVQRTFGRRAGNRHCNLCGRGFAQFAPYGGRPGRMCPGCFSLERHRLLKYYLDKHGGLLTGGVSILHFAPEKCLRALFTAPDQVRYETADLMTQFLPILETKPAHVMSITDIGFPDNTFDLFVCNHVLEHVPDDRRAMCEITRVLRPGGRALLQVPINGNSDQTQEDPTFDRLQRRKHYGSQDHLRYYAAADFSRRLADCGLTVTQFRVADPVIREHNQLLAGEILFVAQKPSA